MCTWHSTQGMIHSGGSDNSLKKTVASQPASPFPETAEQISSQPRLFLHPQASQHISQTGALQPPALTQHHGMLYGDFSVVTDQTYSPYPYHVLPHRPPYCCAIQQHYLQRRPISYLQTMPHSRQHTFPSNGSGLPQSLIQHHDSSSNLTTGHYSRGTPHPHHNQPPLPHNPHQVQPYRPPPHQTSQYPRLYPQLASSQGVTSQPISPHHPGYSHSPALNALYEGPQYHHQQRDGHHFREQLMYSLLKYLTLGLATSISKPILSQSIRVCGVLGTTKFSEPVYFKSEFS